MVRWQHLTLRSTGLVIGSTIYRIDSEGIVLTEDGDDPPAEAQAVMASNSEFKKVNVKAPAKPSAPKQDAAPAKAQEEAPAAPPEPKPKAEAKPKRAPKKKAPAKKK